MLKSRVLLTKTSLFLAVLGLGLGGSLFSPGADALDMPNRSVTISTAIVSATNVTNNFQFTVPSTNAIGSIVFEYCDNTAIRTVPCNAPPGLDVDNVTLTAQSGNTGFSVNNGATNANKIVIFRSPSVGAAVPSSYTFTNITNPSDANHTTYVRISTHITTNGSGAVTDNGAVAFSTVSPFAVNTFVPPFINVCVGVTVAIDCSSTNGSGVDLGVLSSSATRFATTEFSAGTNSATGYILYVLGTTMTSGNNIIPAINPEGGAQIGLSQFGINLRANTSPAVGQEPQGVGTGVPQAGYNAPNLFKLQSGDAIAASSLSTDYNHMTVSYVANVSVSQAPGIYNTTLTYMGVGQF